MKRTSRGEALRRQLVSHVTVALSKAAHSGPFCCVCEREPLPLRVLDQERISALRVQLPAAGERFRSGEGCALVCGGTRAPSFGGKERGPQHAVCRSPGSGRAQCTPWRNFAPISSSTQKHCRASARTRGMVGSRRVGANIVQRHTNKHKLY